MKFKNILVLYDYTAYTYKWLSALISAKKQFKKVGYNIIIPELFYGLFNKFNIDSFLKRKYKDSDVIMVAFHPAHTQLHDNYGKIIELLKILKQKCKKLVWLDITDSTGTTYFQVLPYVDFYLKKQIFSNLDMYKNDYVGNRIWLDYYHKELNLPAIEDDLCIHLDDQFYDKIRLSWNIGVGKIFEKNKFKFFFSLSRRNEKIKIISKEKEYDVFFNGSISDDLYGIQRKMIVESLLNSSFSHPELSKRVSSKEYFENLQKTKIGVSPYGYGEICYRDFEIIKNGAILCKPDMSHLKTYPNFYVPFETYIPFNWDISDLNQNINSVLQDNKLYEYVKVNSQNILKEFYSDEGKTKFVNHVLESIDCLD